MCTQKRIYYGQKILQKFYVIDIYLFQVTILLVHRRYVPHVMLALLAVIRTGLALLHAQMVCTYKDLFSVCSMRQFHFNL